MEELSLEESTTSLWLTPLSLVQTTVPTKQSQRRMIHVYYWSIADPGHLPRKYATSPIDAPPCTTASTLAILSSRKSPAACAPTSNEETTDGILMTYAVFYLRWLSDDDVLIFQYGVVSKRIKEAYPQITEDIGQTVFILPLFPPIKWAFEERHTQEQVDALRKVIGSKPDWWEIRHWS